MRRGAGREHPSCGVPTGSPREHSPRPTDVHGQRRRSDYGILGTPTFLDDSCTLCIAGGKVPPLFGVSTGEGRRGPAVLGAQRGARCLVGASGTVSGDLVLGSLVQRALPSIPSPLVGRGYRLGRTHVVAGLPIAAPHAAGVISGSRGVRIAARGTPCFT
jgi:hypothetical protein